MEEKQLFKVVEFIDYSTSEKRSVDVVYATHIRYDPIRGLVAKFMDGPLYSEEDSKLIREIVKNQVPAPEDWPEFKIKIIEKTETYEEALKKLDKLDKSKYFCTTDSEDASNPIQLSTKNVNDDTSDDKNDNEEVIENLFDVPELNASPIKHSSDKNASKEISGSSNDKEETSGQSEFTESTKHASKRKNTFSDSSFLAKKRFKDAHNFEEKLGMFFDYLVKLQEDVTFIKYEITQIKKKNVQNALCQETLTENLTSKFDVNLPLQTMEEFDKLDTNLPNNKDLQHSLKSALLYNVNLKNDLKKIVRQILAALLSRGVAMKFTALKPMPDKKLFCETNCCKLIEGLIPFKSTESKEKYSKPEIIAAIGYVLTRSYDWGNGRNERRKKKENNVAN